MRPRHSIGERAAGKPCILAYIVGQFGAGLGVMLKKWAMRRVKWQKEQASASDALNLGARPRKDVLKGT